MILEFQTAAQAVKAGADLLRGVMTAEKALSEAEWKLKLADAISLLADARMAIVDAGEKSAELENEVSRLKDALQAKEQLVRHHGVYFNAGQDGGPEGEAYCSHCVEVDAVQVHIIRPINMNNAYCPRCKSVFDKRSTAPLPKRAAPRSAEVTPPQGME